MKKLTGEEIINTYFDYFKSHGHTVIESAPLIPKDDPSILWINAGVTPLKKYFDGRVVPENKRLVSVQKCIRTGDIESVGKTARHHTFFQMLGNFSIGDYFKKEAITMAFELLTSDKYYGIPKDKLYMTVYPDDTEAYDTWVKVGVEPSHIIKLEGNYWEIGEGPSGPDSEIFFDRGEKYDKKKLGIKLLQEEIENDRYIEIWNNVFSQYNAEEGIPRSEYKELPHKNIDTGMGVERMACIMQETETNYETDLFMPIINKIEEISKVLYKGQMEFKVIADHIRTLVFALSDGAVFDNYGRGYVLKRLLRRSVRMGKKLGINKSFLADLVDVVVDKYIGVYRNLNNNISEIKELITKEEELFQRTLLSGEKRLEELFNSNVKEISGEDAFKLYDTYGFPIELTIEIAEEKGFSVNKSDFEKYMKGQKELARNNRKVDNSMNIQNELLINYKEESKFVGYDVLENTTKIITLIKDNKFVDSITDNGYVVLEETPFYAESGGQVADTGYIMTDIMNAKVLDVIKAPNGQHLMFIEVINGTLSTGMEVKTSVDKQKRLDTCKNHSSVHIIQKTLQELLSDSVHQAGSKVDENTFRFDFTYQGKLSDEIILDVERRANERVNMAVDTKIEIMPLNDAIKLGAMALFEDKYGSNVRVVTIGDSKELCAGTHVKNSKDINRIAILSIENKGSNVYRILGSTDTHIEKMMSIEVSPYRDEISKLLEKAKKILLESSKLNIKLDFDFNVYKDVLDSYSDVIGLRNSVNDMKLRVKELEKEFLNKKSELSVSDLSAFLDSVIKVNDLSMIVAITSDYEIPVLKGLVDALGNKYNEYFILLANVKDNNVNFVAKTNSDKINCGPIIKELALKCSGNGGGSKVFAQGGGTKIDNLSTDLQDVKDYIRSLFN